MNGQNNLLPSSIAVAINYKALNYLSQNTQSESQCQLLETFI
jgi:hypothetical protein